MRLVVEFGLRLVVLSGLSVCVCGVRCFWAALFVLMGALLEDRTRETGRVFSHILSYNLISKATQSVKRRYVVRMVLMVLFMGTAAALKKSAVSGTRFH